MNLPAKLAVLTWVYSVLCPLVWADVLDSPESIVVITSDQRAITGMEELAARDMAS